MVSIKTPSPIRILENGSGGIAIFENSMAMVLRALNDFLSQPKQGEFALNGDD
jgi:hypothetical protein